METTHIPMLSCGSACTNLLLREFASSDADTQRNRCVFCGGRGSYEKGPAMFLVVKMLAKTHHTPFQFHATTTFSRQVAQMPPAEPSLGKKTMTIR
eukprot:683037-Hanusia_phi.AAC.1